MEQMSEAAINAAAGVENEMRELCNCLLKKALSAVMA
jgi:hypothetical protein